ncbi:MAG TPA: HPr kinase/phosphatase C-terminal domain-containing protein [Acetobacteraceae bacterium]
MNALRHIHASCVARDGAGVLLLGPPGSGKSDLALRLISRGFLLVGDDQVTIQRDTVRPAAALAGLLEVRGLGIVRMPFAAEAKLVLMVDLAPGRSPAEMTSRMPEPCRTREGVPVIALDPCAASAPDRVILALDCALGRVTQLAGAFAP